jgi:hypothetical protein
MSEPGDVDIQSRGKPAQCPYCHFGLKSSETVSCPGCRAGHHLECWAENGGCAVLGCSAAATPGPAAVVPAQPMASRAAVTPPPPPAPAVAPAAHRGGSSSMLVVACVVAVIAIAGAVAAVALTRSADSKSAGVTQTVTRAAATPRDPGSDGVTPPSASSETGRLVQGASYSFRLPAGFETESSGVYHAAERAGENSYTESQWRSTEYPNTEIHIDYTTGFTSDLEESTRGVRSRRHKGPDYHEYSFGSYTRGDGSLAWRWHFSSIERGVEMHRVAYYLAGCDTGYALLGVTPASSWEQLSDVFETAAASLHPRC